MNHDAQSDHDAVLAQARAQMAEDPSKLTEAQQKAIMYDRWLSEQKGWRLERRPASAE